MNCNQRSKTKSQKNRGTDSTWFDSILLVKLNFEISFTDPPGFTGKIESESLKPNPTTFPFSTTNFAAA
jgi:hypothetical protein